MKNTHEIIMSRLFYLLCVEYRAKLLLKSSIERFDSRKIMTFTYQSVTGINEYYYVREKFSTVDLPFFMANVGSYSLNSIKSTWTESHLVIVIDLIHNQHNLPRI